MLRGFLAAGDLVAGITYAHGNLYVVTQRGDMFLLKPTAHYNEFVIEKI